MPLVSHASLPLPPIKQGFVFSPKHKANSYASRPAAAGVAAAGVAADGGGGASGATASGAVPAAAEMEVEEEY